MHERRGGALETSRCPCATFGRSCCNCNQPLSSVDGRSMFRFHTQTCARGEGLLLHLSLSGQRVTNLPSPAWRENRAAPETRRAWNFVS